MKVVKKLFAAVCALAMMAAMTATMVSAEPILVVKPILTETSEGVYDLAINVDASSMGSGNTRVLNIQFDVELDDAIFDMAKGPNKVESVWSDADFDYVDTYPNRAFLAKFVNGSVKYIPETNIMRYVFAPTASGAEQNLPSAQSIVTYKGLQLLDGVETEDVTIKVSNVVASIGSSWTTYTEFKGANVDCTTEVVFPGNKSTEPDPTPVEVPATQVKNGDSNVFEGFNGIDTDRSVAAMVDTTLTKGTNKVTWKINVTPQAGKTYTGPKTLDATFGNLESGSNMKVGLIVSYADADIANVEITGIEY